MGRLGALGAVGLAWAAMAWGQQAPAFEVASIKPAHDTTAEPNVDSRPGGRLTADNITVRELIRLAFGVKDHQIAGAPAWIDRDGFDIAAKTAEPPKKEDLPAMIRQLLEERLRLVSHRETRQLPVYLLVVGKDGPKLQAHNEGTGSGTRKGCGRLTGTRLTMDTIATVLSRQFEREVLNRTELPGKYDFQLEWTPDAGPCPATAGSLDRPSILAAIQEQLGLRLVASKGPVEILVVERVERPSEN